MVLESTIICVDNSDYMRNGDFLPTRMQAQQDAVSLICHSKLRSNPENHVGLLTLANPEVLATLTTDVGRILSKLHQLQPKGDLNLVTGIRIAHLALKHRQGKHHKMRLVVFVGSPIADDEKEQFIKVAKRFKKEKVCVDIVNFGEDALNTEKLTFFINTLNGKEGGGSHLVTVPPGPHLSDALVTSPVVQGEDGTGGVGLGGMGFEFGVDPNEDPELALALRVSMEEQRQRQEEEARRSASASGGPETPSHQPADAGSSEEALLEQAVAMSLATEGLTVGGGGITSGSRTSGGTLPDLASMTEEEQIAYAMQMSLQQSHDAETPMETDEQDQTKDEDDDYQEVMEDPEFLQSVLEDLPGVDPKSDEVQSAVGSLSGNEGSSKGKKSPKKDGDKKDKS